MDMIDKKATPTRRVPRLGWGVVAAVVLSCVALSLAACTSETPRLTAVYLGHQTKSTTSLCSDISRLDRLVVTRHLQIKGNDLTWSFPARVTATDPALVRRVARFACRLPRLPKGPLFCPADFGIVYRLSFSAGPVTFPPLLADSSGCEQLTGLGPTATSRARWIATHPGFWRVLGDAIGLRHATVSTFAGTFHT